MTDGGQIFFHWGNIQLAGLFATTLLEILYKALGQVPIKIKLAKRQLFTSIFSGLIKKNKL